jgi:hypothetical protein
MKEMVAVHRELKGLEASIQGLCNALKKKGVISAEFSLEDPEVFDRLPGPSNPAYALPGPDPLMGATNG